MSNLTENVELIAAKLEEVAGDPNATRERMTFWLQTAARVLRDVASVFPAEIDYELDKINPEGTA
jgi:hypothetical protein